MNEWHIRMRRDEGWTFIEAILGAVLISIMVLGLTIVMLAFKEHLDRSWAIRAMDQYGNDVIERLTHDLRNAVNVTIRRQNDYFDKVEVEFLEPLGKNVTYLTVWQVDRRRGVVWADREQVDPGYPPRAIGRGEGFSIVEFTLRPFGQRTWRTIAVYQEPEQWEQAHLRTYLRNETDFTSSVFDIRLELKYIRAGYRFRSHGNRPYEYSKVFFNRVYVRNKNLLIARGYTGGEDNEEEN